MDTYRLRDPLVLLEELVPVELFLELPEELFFEAFVEL